MKILLLSDSNSSHTIKWVTSLAERNHEIILFSLADTAVDVYKKYKSIIVKTAGIPIIKKLNDEAHISKLVYLKSIPIVKKIIKEYEPDILHSHYASSYGLIGALSNFHPFIISVWGSDVFNFPNRSLVHKKILKYSLSKSDKILSTSFTMAGEVKKYSTKTVEITPFGVDLNKFKPSLGQSLFKDEDIVVGTIKSLEDKYGVDLLIRSFKNVKDKYPNLSLKLLIVGTGTKENQLKQIVESLAINNDTIFTGFIEHEKIPQYHNMLDIALFLSVEESESFGVSVIESCACEKPVIVSNIGGFPEVVEDNVTGIIVEPKNIESISQAIEKLLTNKELRTKLGKNGRERVTKLYNWEENMKHIDDVYRNLSESFINKLGRENVV